MNQYEIKITGKDLKRFIKNLHNLKIELYNIYYKDNSVYIRVSLSDYKKILEIKTIYEIEVVRLYGPIYILDCLKKWRIFLIFLVIGIMVITFLSHLIFEIDIVHTKKEIRDLLSEELAKRGISKYHFVLSFDRQEKIVEEIIRENRSVVEWMEIERKGVKYIIKVEERKEKDINNDDTPRDIVAKKDGYVTNILASQGSVLVTPGTYVKKGDILITGSIKNKDTLMAKVKADGKVFAEVWYDITVSLPYHYKEESKTGNKKKVLRVNFLNKSINLFDFDKYKDKRDEVIYSIKNNLIPISLGIYEEEELIKKDYLYTKETAILEASNMARSKLLNKLGQEDEILYEKSLKIMEEDSKIIVVIFFKVKEDITSYQDISDLLLIDEKS